MTHDETFTCAILCGLDTAHELTYEQAIVYVKDIDVEDIDVDRDSHSQNQIRDNGTYEKARIKYIKYWIGIIENYAQNKTGIVSY